MADDMINTYIEDLDEIFVEIEESKGDGMEGLINEAEEILEQLKISIHSIKDPERKNEIQSKIIVARSKLEDAKKASLLDGGISDNVQMSSVARSQASLEVLQKSHQQLLETEEVGNGIIENLDQQEETMRHTTSNLQEINGDLKHSNRLLTKMGRWWRG